MLLSIQLQVLIISFIYGILFSYLLKIFYRYLFRGKLFYRIIFIIFFIFSSYSLYFLILLKINNGIFHVYFFMLLVGGFLFGNKLICK